MSEDDLKDKKGKKSDYAEVEFEIGNIEFEAKGRSVVVERMFRLLLERIEEGKLVKEFRLVEPDEEEEEEEEKKSLLWTLHPLGISLIQKNQKFQMQRKRNLTSRQFSIHFNDPAIVIFSFTGLDAS